MSFHVVVSRWRPVVLVASVLLGLAAVGANRRAIASNWKQALLAGPPRPAVSTDWPSEPVLRRSRPRPAFVPGHIVVKFDPTVSARAMEATAREIGARGILRPSYADFVYVEIPRDADPVRAAAALSGRPGVIYAEPDPQLYPMFRPNDPLYRFQWNFQRIDMERAWDINPGGATDIIVAVLDTGVAYLNGGEFAQAPDLRGTRFVPGYDFVWDDTDPVDLDGHGTHVSGTIAGTTNNGEGVAGIAFNVRLMPVKVLFGVWDDRRGAAYPYGESTLARGIRFAVDNGARILSLSLAGVDPNTATEQALRDAVARGAFIAIAAGNWAIDCDVCPPGVGPNPVAYPAKYAEDIDGVMAVGALDYNLRRAFYSSFQSYVEIAAPGGDVLVDLNGDGVEDGVIQQTFPPSLVEAGIFNQFSYEPFMGTSQATPHVAGFAALLMHQGVTSPAAIEAAIKRFAVDVEPAGPDPFTGYGVLNPRGTLLGLGLLR